jgi:serine/threonine protein kinase
MKGLDDSNFLGPGPDPAGKGISACGDSSAAPDSLEPTPHVLRLLEEYMAELENGRRPNVDDFVARHPEIGDLSDHLRGYLASLDFLHSQNPPVALEPELQLENAVEDLPPANPALGRLGDFNLIREIGRGGMGIVYEAVQISLQRRVALKVLPLAAALDTKQLQRFKNEALAAAGLHHPQIVPIYGVGTERGVHYYAMQLIEGQSLAEVIVELRSQKRTSIEHRNLHIEDRGPKTENRGSEKTSIGSTVQDRHRDDDDTPINGRGLSVLDSPSSNARPLSSIFDSRSLLIPSVARLGIQAAEALGHAHRLGIVHRDIKPANLILDDDGKLWVTDFGLAMVHSNMELTATGDLLGTLRYMSPEQASAKRGLIDQRTDIYSLGTTLYELLALEPAFPDKDRNQLLTRITTEDPRPPRRLNPVIPKDLETIVLKSMAKIPTERYTTAEELAEDLKRFLDDRPIRATRPTIVERSLKWCRRHKAVVATAVALSMTAVILAAILFYDGKKRAFEATVEERNRQIHEQQLLLEQRQRLLDNFTAIKDALDELCLRPAMERLAKNPDPQKQREDQELLRKVLVHYQRFADLNIKEAGPRALTAYAGRQVGNILQALGDPDRAKEAKEAYEKAIGTLTEVIAENPTQPGYRAELARCRNALGNLFWSNSQPEQAEQTLALETKDLEQAVRDFPQVTDFRGELANCRQNLSLLLRLTGQTREAEDVLRENFSVLEELTSSFPDRLDYQKALAANHSRLGEILRETGKPKESEKCFVVAEEMLERLNKSQPLSEYKSARANAAYNIGLLCREAGRLPDSEKAYQRSIDISKTLVAEYPLMPDYGLELAMEEHQLGLTFTQMQRFPEAESSFHHSKDLLERLVRDFPAKQRYQEELACCSNNFGILWEKTHQTEDAETSYARSAQLLEDLANRFPRMLDYHSDLGGARFSQARLLADRHENEKAGEFLKQAIDHQRIAIEGNPRSPQYFAPLWPQYQLLLKLLAEDHKNDQVILVLQDAQEKCKNMPSILNNLAWWMVRLPQAPFGNVEIGLQMAKQATERNPRNGDHWNTLGVAHFRAGNWKESIAALEQSRTLRSGGDSYDYFFLAMAHWQMGEKDQARDWHQKAIAKLPKVKNEELKRIQEEAEKLLKAAPGPDVGKVFDAIP